MGEQPEMFPKSDLEILESTQIHLTTELDKADKAVESAVEKHRLALDRLQEIEALIVRVKERGAAGVTVLVDGNGEVVAQSKE